MPDIIGRIKRLRTGGVTGAGFTENNIKMMGALLAPFLAGWSFIKFFLPVENYDINVTILLVFWLLWCILLWAYAKSDANNYIVFPQSKWRFPDGSSRTFDLKVPPDSWELVKEFKNGDKGYEVGFSDTFLFDDPDLPFPLLFNRAYWILPALWDTSFQRRAYGEFFHKGVYVTKPDCEDISVYVTHYEPTDLGNIPVCIINDCALTYQQTIENAKRMDRGEKALYNAKVLAHRQERKKRLSLLGHTAFLEDRVAVAEKDASKDFKKSADERMKASRRRHARIMDVKEGLLTRIFNLKNVAIAIIVIAIIYFAGRLIFHVW